MKIVFYSDYSDAMEKDSSKGPVRRVLEELKNSYPLIYAAVKTVFEELQKGEVTLEELTELEKFGTLKGVKVPLKEFRIPPKGRSGVFRAYCSVEGSVISIYSAEIKKNYKANADKEKISQAEQRYNSRINSKK